MKSTLSILILSIILFGCKTSEKLLAKKYECFSVIHPNIVAAKTKANVKILSVLVEGNSLNAEVEYTTFGTSYKTEPYMAWNGALMKSLPPKASVEIGMYYVNPCANCDTAIAKTSLCFDITKLRENTRKQGLVLLIEGFDKSISIPAEK